MRIVWRILAQDDNFFWLPQNSSGADSSHSAELRSWSGQADSTYSRAGENARSLTGLRNDKL